MMVVSLTAEARANDSCTASISTVAQSHRPVPGDDDHEALDVADAVAFPTEVLDLDVVAFAGGDRYLVRRCVRVASSNGMS